MNDADRTFYTIELEEMGTLELPEYRTDDDALKAVGYLRALNDPAYKPAWLVKHDVKVTDTITRIPLGMDHSKVVKAVREKLIASKGQVPSGQDGLEWAVRATLAALDE